MYYAVDWGPGGNCSNFIRTLIMYNLVRDTSSISFQDGNSHEYPMLMQDKVPNVIGCRIDPTLDPLAFEHLFGNELFEYVSIYFSTVKDIETSILFHFIKAQRNRYGLGGRIGLLNPTETKKVFNETFLPEHDIVLTGRPAIDDNHPYKDSIHFLDFGDILNDKNKVIDLIEQITNKSVLPELHKVYDNYLLMQRYIISRFS